MSLAQNLPSRLDWLAIKFQQSTFLCISSARITNTHDHGWLFYLDSVSQTWILRLPYWLSHILSPMHGFLITTCLWHSCFWICFYWTYLKIKSVTMVGYMYNPSTWEVKAGASKVQSQPGLQRRHIRSCLNKKNKRINKDQSIVT